MQCITRKIPLSQFRECPGAPDILTCSRQVLYKQVHQICWCPEAWVRRETVPPPTQVASICHSTWASERSGTFISCSYNVSTMSLRSPWPSLHVCATQWHTNTMHMQSCDCVQCHFNMFHPHLHTLPPRQCSQSHTTLSCDPTTSASIPSLSPSSMLSPLPLLPPYGVPSLCVPPA